MRIGATALFFAVASVRLNPFGVQSGLSRRSTVTSAAFTVDVERDLEREPVRHAGERVELGGGVDTPTRQRSDGFGRAMLAVVEPRAHEGVHATGAEFVVQLVETTLRDSPCRDHREVVAVPHLGYSDPTHAHPNDVLHVGEVALHAHAGEDQCTLCVDIFRVGQYVVGTAFPMSA